jgi:hypothetical protein
MHNALEVLLESRGFDFEGEEYKAIYDRCYKLEYGE